MTPKQRFLSTIYFKRPDAPALEYYYTDVGYAEHGEKLLKLYRKYPGDAAPVPFAKSAGLPGPDPADFDAYGNYRRVTTDEWGTKWEYRVYGRIGHAIEFPLDDMDVLDGYKFPRLLLSDPSAYAAFAKKVKDESDEYPVSHSVPGLLERMIALRPFEKVLMDIAEGDCKIARLADALTEHFAEDVALALSAGADIIRMGDDYGTGRAPLISPDMWRVFILPRIKKIIDPVKKAGKTCCFHSCGQIYEILPDLKKAGADSIWPQLPLYDYGDLAARLRELGLALCIHIDRGELMQHGRPEDVRAEVGRIYNAFRPDLGGSWFYFEVDQGFPFENIVALAEAIAAYRS